MNPVTLETQGHLDHLEIRGHKVFKDPLEILGHPDLQVQLVRWVNQVQRDQGDLPDHVDSKVKEEHLDLQVAMEYLERKDRQA